MTLQANLAAGPAGGFGCRGSFAAYPGDSPKTITVSFANLPAEVTASGGYDDENTITITTTSDD